MLDARLGDGRTTWATSPTGIVFGRSATQLTLEFARTLARGLGTRGTRSWSPGSTTTGTSDPGCWPPSGSGRPYGGWTSIRPPRSSTSTSSRPSCTPRTRLVAVTGASNLLGTIPDHPRIAETRARGPGRCCGWTPCTWPPMSASIGQPSAPTSWSARRTSSAGRTSGCWPPTPTCWPGCGPTSCCPPAMPCRSGSSSAPCRTSCWPAPRAAVDYLAGLGEGEDRPLRLTTAFARLVANEHVLRTRLEEGLRERGATIYSRAARRTSTMLFDLPGTDGCRCVARISPHHGVAAPAGSLLRDRGVPAPRTRGPRCRPCRARPLHRRWRRGRLLGALDSCPDPAMAQQDRRCVLQPPPRRSRAGSAPASMGPGLMPRLPLRSRASRARASRVSAQLMTM